MDGWTDKWMIKSTYCEYYLWMLWNILRFFFDASYCNWHCIFLHHTCVPRDHGVNDLSIETPNFVPFHHHHSSRGSLVEDQKTIILSAEHCFIQLHHRYSESPVGVGGRGLNAGMILSAKCKY